MYELNSRTFSAVFHCVYKEESKSIKIKFVYVFALSIKKYCPHLMVCECINTHT